MNTYVHAIVRLLIVSAAVACGAVDAFAAEPEKEMTPEEVLAARELKKIDKKFILNDEASVGKAFKEVRPDIVEYHEAMDQQAAIAGVDQQFANATMEKQNLVRDNQQIQIELNNIVQRRVIKKNNYNSTQMQWDKQVQLNKQRINELDRVLDTLKQQRPAGGPKMKMASDAERLRKKCVEKLADLEEAVKAVEEKYRALGKDEGVQEALGTLKKTTKVTHTLGPSEEFKVAARQMREERALLGTSSKGSSTPAKKEKKKSAR